MSRPDVAARLARAVAAAVLVTAGTALAQPVQTPLPGASLPKYVDPVPTFVGQRVGGPFLVVSMKETTQKPLPASFYATLPPQFSGGTTVWGYQVTGLDVSTGQPVSRGPSWPGFTVEARRDVATSVLYSNDLRTPTLQSLLPVDQTIEWADPFGLGCSFQGTMSPACMRAYKGPVPTVVHLHGSEVPPASDGGPDAWFTITGRHGPNYSSLTPVLPNQALYRYPNQQEGSTLWFHDHAFGTTRLNVYGGIAAFYLLRDGEDTGRAGNPIGLPAGAQEIELVMQDRAFDVNGQLMYYDPAQVANPGIHPLWRPEFFGDVITVNGKSWPRLDVEPRRYRFRLLNGSNARFYELSLAKAFAAADPTTHTGLAVTSAGPVFWQIGTDGGRLDRPVPVSTLRLAPGERADVIVDFSSVPAGTKLTLVNGANAPYPGGDPVDIGTTAQVMQFDVVRPLSSPDGTCNPASSGASRCRLRSTPIVRLADARTGDVAAGVNVAVKRQLILREQEGATGPLEAELNNTKYMGFQESTLTTLTPTPVPGSTGLGGNFATELPRVGSTEVWEIGDLTVDAHPIHVHLVQFQILSRQTMNTGFDAVTGAPFGYVADWLAQLPHGDATLADGPPKLYSTVNADGAVGGNLAFGPYLQGARRPADPNEAGWKDTVVVFPGEVTRVAVRWAPQGVPLAGVGPGVNLYPFDPSLTDSRARDAFGNPGAAGYVWHCHILEHEDNEMMRPYGVAR